jgi:hypothetical protein
VRESEESIFRALVGSELASVVFVRDYIQLSFSSQPPLASRAPAELRPAMVGTFGTLSAYTDPWLEKEGRTLQLGDPGYRDALVEQIGCRVTGVHEGQDWLRVEFDGGVTATVSLSEDDLPAGSVESAMLQLDDEAKSWMVWRPADHRPRNRGRRH